MSDKNATNAVPKPISKKNPGVADARIQWHPAFAASMGLEFREYKEVLKFEKEYNLNTRPLEIDLLILKGNADTVIENEIGRIFRGHNILEYKSPCDHLDIDVLYKVEGYAALYKAYGRRLDSIKAEDVTVSLIRQTKPYGLFRQFKKLKIPVSNPYPGIYYIEKQVPFPTQIVVVRELDKASHIWLGALSGKLEKQDMAGLFERAMQLKEKDEKEFADSVLQVSVTANRRIADELKGGNAEMCQALMQLMEPEIRQIRQESRILEYIDIRREDDYTDKRIMEDLMKKFALTAKEAEEYLKERITV